MAWFPVGLVIMERRENLHYQGDVSIGLTMQSQLGFSSTSEGRVSDKDRDHVSAKLGGRGKALFLDILDLAKREKQRLQVRILSEQNRGKIVNDDARKTRVST